MTTPKKLDFVCDLGHKYQKTKYRAHQGCPYCGGRKVLKGFNDIATLCPDLVAEWNDTNYAVTELGLGSTRRINWKCSHGHTWKQTVNSRVANRSGCPYCSGNKVWIGFNDLPTTHPHLASIWDDDRDIHTVSAGSGYKARWKCDRGHVFSRNVHLLVRDSSCRVCKGLEVSPGVNDFATKFPDLALQWHPDNDLLPTEVSYGSGYMAKWKCGQGHEYTATVNGRTSQRGGCAQCRGRRPRANTVGADFPQFMHYFKNEGDLSLTTGSHQIVELVCPEGHEFTRSVRDLSRALHPCPRCGKTLHTGKSSQEYVIKEMVESLGLKVVHGARGVISGKELDIYVPDRKIAIEFNGLFWHTESRVGRNYHYEKWLACKNAGIQLIQIWEDDWNKNKNLVLKMLREKLVSRPSIGARKVSWKVIDYSVARPFLNENHIQGSTVGSHYMGLINDDLVAVGVFKEYADKITLDRYASSLTVMGGLDKMLKRLPEKKLVTFANNDVSSGALYEKTGWIYDGELKPDYTYLYQRQRVHKFNFRLKRFRTDPELQYAPGLSESQLAELNGIPRIYDSGKIRYVKYP